VTSTPGDNINTNQNEASETERWASLVSGSAMVLLGLKQRSLRGVLTALAGGGLIYQGATKKSTIQQAQEVIGQAQEAIGIAKDIKVEKNGND